MRTNSILSLLVLVLIPQMALGYAPSTDLSIDSSKRVYSASQMQNISKQFAGRNMADCMSFMRQFSVPIETANFLCPQIISDAKKEVLPQNQSEHAEVETDESPTVAF